MYLTKLFGIFGVLLIATLGQTEGRRRWLKRTGENIECARHKKVNFTNGAVPDEDNINVVQERGNDTEINHRGSCKWHKSKCNDTKCFEAVSNTTINVNSSDSESTQDNSKIQRTSRFSRRMNCSGRKIMFNRIANKVAAINVRHDELPPSDNDEGQNFRRNRKYRGRPNGHRGKCVRSQSEADQENNKESTKSVLNNTHSLTIEEPTSNIN